MVAVRLKTPLAGMGVGLPLARSIGKSKSRVQREQGNLADRVGIVESNPSGLHGVVQIWRARLSASRPPLRIFGAGITDEAPNYASAG